MGRHGLLGSSSRFPTRLPRLALPLLRPPSRCSIRADRRHPNRRLCTLPRPPEPGDRPPPWLGQLLRRFEQWTNRRRKATELALWAPPLETEAWAIPRSTPWTSGCGPVATRRRARGEDNTPRDTPPANPSWPGGPTRSSPNSALSATPGWRPWTPGE